LDYCVVIQASLRLSSPNFVFLPHASNNNPQTNTPALMYCLRKESDQHTLYLNDPDLNDNKKLPVQIAAKQNMPLERSLLLLATGHEIVTARANNSYQHLPKLLEIFGGPKYQAEQSEIVNHARVAYLTYLVRQSYERKNWQDVMAHSELCDHSNSVTINASYQLPPYLAWQVIYFRLLAFAQSKQHLPNFHQTFITYSEAIDKTIPTKVRAELWDKTILPALNQTVHIANNQLFNAAIKDKIPTELKLQYLSLISKQLPYVSPWSEVLRPEHLLWAAYDCFLNQKNHLTRLYLDKLAFIDLEKILNSTKDHDFSSGVRRMYKTIYNDQYTWLIRLTLGQSPFQQGPSAPDLYATARTDVKPARLSESRHSIFSQPTNTLQHQHTAKMVKAL